MRLLILKSLIFIGSIMALSTFENWYFAETIERFVLQVDGEGGVLLAQNLELEEADFQRTYREWFSGDYQVVEVLDVADVTTGMHIRVSFDSRLEDESTFRLKAVDYEVVDVAFAVMEMMVPASTEVREELTLENIFPQKEGRLQVFSHLKERGYIQELIEVRETEAWQELYFEGQGLDDDSRQFNLMYQINNNQVLEYIHNQDPNPLLGSETLLNSIIERKIILQAPLVVGHSWEQMFIFNGQEYTAVTELVRVQSNDAGKMEYETLTRVEDIEGFYGNIYEERRVFVEGSGMTNFSNSQFLNQLSTEEDVHENFEFTVSLSTEYQERFVMSQNIEAENPEDEVEAETNQRELPTFDETME